MKEKKLRLKTSFKAVMLVLMLCGVGITEGYAYDFSAFNDGHRLYYIINGSNVTVTYPGNSPEDPYANYPKPTGNLVIPATVTNSTSGITYNVTSIGECAFYDCTGLNTVTFSSSIISIGSNAFYHFWGDKLYYQGSISQWCGITFENQNSNPLCGGSTVHFYLNGSILRNLVIPSDVTHIPDYAFHGIQQLETITFGSSINHIGYNAFWACFNSSSTNTYVNYQGSISQWCGITFENRYSNPCYGYRELRLNGNILNDIIIPSDISQIHDYAFCGIASCHSITIGNSVTYIGNYSFKDCVAAESMTIGNMVSYIGDYAFSCCANINHVTIPNTVTYIGDYAFDNCIRISSVVLGDSLITIGNAAFKDCSSLVSITIPNDVISIGSYAFSNCTQITSVTIGESVTSIGAYAFSNCTHLTSVIIGESVTYIGEYAFQGCFSISNITVYANNPPALSNNVFDGVHHYFCHIYIPCGATYAYTSATLWNAFTNYHEMDCPSEITVIANPIEGGSVTGGGSYDNGSSCTIVATNNTGYTFVNWTNNSTAVSSNPSYTFTVTQDATFVANFTINTYSINASVNPIAGGSVTGAGIYNHGSNCTLTANANSGYTFVNWTKNGSVVSTNSTYSFSVTENASYTANFSLNNYTISATPNPAAGGTVTGSGTYNHGETVTLTANPNTGYTFVNWTKNGAAVSTNTTYSFTATETSSYVANFIPIYEITATANPVDGGTVTGGGSYNQGAYCSLIAMSNPGYTFVNWTKNGTQVSTNNTYTFTVTEACSYVANFVPLLEITTTSNPLTGGSTSGSGTYSYGSTCTITAIANTGYTFVNWTKDGTIVSTNSTCSFTVNENANYVANFNLNSYTITVTADPTIGGNAFGGGTYNHGESCTLVATANNNYNFINWTKDGTVVSANAEYTFTVTSGGNYAAHFSQNIYYTVVALANPEEGGTITGSGTFSQGEQCTLTASANTGYTFVNWTKNGSIVSTNTTYSFIVNETAEYIANFSTNSHSVTAMANPVEGGYITGTGTYSYGSTATLTAIANDGYTFESWMQNGMVISNSSYIIITVTDNVNFIANFSHNSYSINASVDPINSGVITGQGNYNYGETVIISVIPNANYVFTNWTENGSVISEEPSFSFTVTENRNFVANLIFVDCILETEFPNFTVYPNPATDNLYIDGTTNIRCCEIYTSNGRLVYKHSENSNKIKVNVSNLSSGGYIVKIHFDNMICTKKIVIE